MLDEDKIHTFHEVDWLESPIYLVKLVSTTTTHIHN